MQPQEIAQLYQTMNQTAINFGEDCLLHELVSRQCTSVPDRVAVVWQDQQLTYAELDQLSNAIAARLSSQGVAPGDLVGICCSRQLDMPALLLGILKAGAAYVPLDPEYPLARLKDMVSDSRIQVVLAHPAQEPIVASFGVPVIFADGIAPSCHNSISIEPQSARLLDSSRPHT